MGGGDRRAGGAQAQLLVHGRRHGGFGGSKLSCSPGKDGKD
jgi:hypothetical protein